MLYSTLLRLWDREIEAITSPKIPLAADPNMEDRILVHHVAPHSNKLSMVFEVVLTADGEIERWVHLAEDDQLRIKSKKMPTRWTTFIGTHRFEQDADVYETRVLAMRD